MLPFKDISYAQGNYDMQSNPNSIIAIRMSSGDGGLHFDSQAATNYKNATDYGKVVINYHFAGNSDPTTEANFFIEAVSPFAENDVYCLDHELGQSAEWCQTFMDVVHSATGCWPLDYEDISLANSMGPRPNCGLWLAAPSWGFDQTITELNPDLVYVAQQGPIVGGVGSDAWFGTLDELQAYGYHAPVAPTPAPVPVPTPEPTPQPAPMPMPTPDPLPPIIPPTPPVAPFPVAPEPTSLWQDIKNLWSRVLQFIYKKS
jgi:hypothetical protein